MIEIIPIKEHEYDLAFRIMHENMELYHHAHDVPWDQDWIAKNYIDKDSYSIVCSGRWRGCLSLEWRGRALFIHTLQLTREAQGSIYGYRVYQWLVSQAESRGKTDILCKTFRNSPLLRLYKRLGFSLESEGGILVALESVLTTRTARAWPDQSPRPGIAESSANADPAPISGFPYRSPPLPR